MLDYPVGAAIEPASLTNATESALLIKHFSSITAENVMKPDTIWPSVPGTTQPAASPNFTRADLLVNFAQINNIQLRGHTLLWHRTIPSWMLAGPTSQPLNYRATIQQNLRYYIFAVVQHFPNVYAWDVVNEVASDTQNSANPYRTDSDWYRAYSVGGLNGSDYVRDAFTFANQARSSIGRNSATMKLMLNDYNTELPGKRANVIQIVRELVNGGYAIDGVGHQFHLQLNADVNEVTAALVAVEGVSSTLVNHVTELDVSIYSDPGSCYSTPAIPPCQADYGANPPQTVLSQQALLYRALFNAFNRPSVTSVSLWGIADNHTWLNYLPGVPHQSSAAVRHRGPSQMGFLGRGRSVDPGSIVETTAARIRDNRSRTIHSGRGRWGTHEVSHYCAGRALLGRVRCRRRRRDYSCDARARRGTSR